MMFREILMSKS